MILVYSCGHIAKSHDSGGLGLTGGLADIEGLYDCLIGIHKGRTSDKILDKYDEVRRRMWREFVDVVSSQNLRRLNSQDPEKALDQDNVLQMLLKARGDKDMLRKMQLVWWLLNFLSSVR